MGNCFGRCLSGKNSLRHSTDDQEEELVQEEPHNNNFIFRIMKFKKKKRPNFVNNFMDNRDLNYSRLNQENPANSTFSSDIQLQCLNAQSLMLATRETQQYTRFLNQHHENGGGNVTSSRASSSLDLEWEHEYGHINPLHSSWLFLPDDLAKQLKDEDENDNDDDDNLTIDTDRQSGHSSITNFARNRNLLFKQQQQQQQQQQQKQQQQKLINEQNSMTNNQQEFIQIGKTISRTPSKTSWSHISTPESLEWDIDEEQQKQLRIEDDNLDHETLELLHEIELLKNQVLKETGDGLNFEFSKYEGS